MNNSFEQEYKKLSSKFLEVSLREQVLILFCGLVVVILMMYSLLLEPIFESSEKLQQNSKSADKEIRFLIAQVAELSDNIKTDPNGPVLERIALLKRQILNITNQLKTQTDNLVPANKMAGMLESVLAGSKGLTLIELQSIAPIPISLGLPEEPDAGLYRHGVTLVFQGNYFDIQRYLEKLESLPWQFYWERFDYLVGDYPTASVELEIYTLSTNKAFIGV
ncbi:type II secretion system protein GspM [Paraglaciecola sp. MB-3u-78]|uniref:type II secretion system protein GspM n=1 Tax=Paraglaciecola sp. MB-3u-78 TaxID=2058332 RepID=UPI000C333004|nr:type II secretion system protein GspM [Paraglaciecola sp. MB-3u-78]PKG97777.1 MSHA biogenesis protein MshJ [Paraglaciecola sp. MB-3u-78]